MSSPKLYIFAALLLLPIVAGCGPSNSDAETEREVAIRIDAAGRLFVDGDRVAMWYLDRQISRKLGDEKAIFVITAAPETPMGVLSDVKNRIPVQNIAALRYPLPKN